MTAEAAEPVEERSLDLRAGASEKLTPEERHYDINYLDMCIVSMTLPEYRDEIDQWVQARTERFAYELVRIHGQGGHASAAELKAAMALGGRIAAEGAAKAAARSAYAGGLAEGKAQAEAEAAKRRPAAPTIVVTRNEQGQPVSITETSPDGSVVVKHVEHDAAGRIIRLVAFNESTVTE